ncbi:MAG TPA: glycosyltransferase family 39 protein, partial [Urbifossiella sp.]|nr:glycosyltransferase family 39 protein [Urbifossiella sp.]
MPAPAPRLALAVAAAVAAAGVGWRLTDLREWPFPFHPTVQYDAALAARSLWVAADPAARTPDRDAWFDAVRHEHVISPPVLSVAVAAWYAAAGEEQPWAAKLFAAAAWVAACGFVGAAVRRQTGCRWAAVAAGGWLMFAPFGLMVCRSFCTEPVAVLGLAVAVWVLARPGRQLTWRETLAAGLACGLAAATKPGVLLPPVAAGFAGALLSAGVAGSLTRKAVHTVAFAALLTVPSVLWVVVWLPHRGSELRPGLLADPAF